MKYHVVPLCLVACPLKKRIHHIHFCCCLMFEWSRILITIFRKVYNNWYSVCCLAQGRSGLAGSHTGRSFPKRSFVRPSWMDEDTVDSAGTSESIFFSKVGSHLPSCLCYVLHAFTCNLYLWHQLPLFS